MILLFELKNSPLYNKYTGKKDGNAFVYKMIVFYR